MYKGMRKRKRENLQVLKLAQPRGQNRSPCQKLTICSRPAIFLHVKLKLVAKFGWIDLLTVG